MSVKGTAQKGENLQDRFLNVLRKDGTQVAIYLVNGIKLQGMVDSFDQYVVLLKSGVIQMVYKHAISTIVPAQNMKMSSLGEDEDYDSRYGSELDDSDRL